MQKDVPKVVYHKKKGEGELATQKKWWTASEDRIYESVWPLANFLRESQSIRHNANYRYMNLYANKSVDNLAAAHAINNLAPFYGQSAYTTFNVVKSCVDTAVSKISKQKPRPFFLSENGDWSLQQKAKKLNSFILALFEQMGGQNGINRESLYSIGADAFQDACITGTGSAKVFIRNDKIIAERFLSDELIVDQFEGIYRTPRSMHQVKYVDREVLFHLYPTAKHRRMIEDAQAASTSHAQSTHDMVPVIESYHLPSGIDAKDGKRAVCIETGTLHAGMWDKLYFPYLVQRWSKAPIGYFGIGLAEELQGIQREINSILMKIQTGLNRVAVPRVFRDIADLNAPKRMSNQIGEYHYYVNRPPIIDTPVAFNAETYMHLDRLFQKAFELTGLSQLSATSQKPAGLNAAVAIREYQDIGSERFATVHMMYEGFFTPQATYMVLDLLEDLLKAGVDYVVQSKDGMTMQPIKYSDVRIPLDSMTVRPYPTAYLPAEPAGKFAKVQELVEAGFYDQDEGRELLDFPDLKKTNNIKSAMRNACFSYIETIIDKGVYRPIEPYQDVALTQQLAQSYFLEGRTQNMPEDRLSLLRQVMEECKARLDEIEESAMQKQMEMQQQMAAMQAPQAMPQV